ncbi:hypothetical protein PQU92_02805 [Asticcacaulis sp. BYS171W]|uniref:CdiI immunity protein domain-containing protein n=1 Tax=Asticcacaulis aquaticus TaxID=2984212 RepID=A0ABT5HQ37_9CAUL|nr:hypothetical protein [Asticcacaulis aquaticus]MDC7682188.1 hypothetical protein [Asticcacaulis aquaticus]
MKENEDVAESSVDLHQIWLGYVNEHMAVGAELSPSLEFTAFDVLERFFELHPLFSPRWEAIMSVVYSDAFDEDADAALITAAKVGSFDNWASLSAGVWRNLTERLLYCEVVIYSAAAADPFEITDRLPIGLSHEQQSMSLFLKYFLGHGRSIDRRVLPFKRRRSISFLSPSQSLQRH